MVERNAWYPFRPKSTGGGDKWDPDVAAAKAAVEAEIAGAIAAGAYVPGGTDVPVADGGTGASTQASARTNLGLGTAATHAHGDYDASGAAAAAQAAAVAASYSPGGTDVAVADGGTGASTQAGARTGLGLGTAATHAHGDYEVSGAAATAQAAAIAAAATDATTKANAAAAASAPLSHTHTKTRAVEFMIDGGGAVITAGVKGDIKMPFACTITGWDLLADQAGSITVNIWKDTYANFPPDSSDVLLSPALSSAAKAQATGLSHAVAAGDVLRFNAAATPATVQRVTLSLTLSVTD